MKSCPVILMAVAAGGLLTACHRHEPAAPSAPQAAADDARVQAAQAREEFLASMDKQMAELDVKIDRLQARSAGAVGDARARADQALADLRGRREAVRNEYKDLKASSQETWLKAK